MDDFSPSLHTDAVRVAEPRTDAALDEGPVVVAVDFSPHSEEALRWACDYAATVGAALEIVHVVHDPATAPGQYRPDGDALEPMADVAERKLSELLARFQATHPEARALERAEKICVTGLPAKRILETAEKKGARMLVLGQRGHGDLMALILGSTSQYVARHAQMPVTIVRARSQ